jgi:hypothetical protein
MTRLPSSRRGPTLRSSRARRRLGLDQPTAVIQRVRLDTGNENHLSPMEVRDVARRMILIVAELANPVRAAQKAPCLYIADRAALIVARLGPRRSSPAGECSRSSSQPKPVQLETRPSLDQGNPSRRSSCPDRATHRYETRGQVSRVGVIGGGAASHVRRPLRVRRRPYARDDIEDDQIGGFDVPSAATIMPSPFYTTGIRTSGPIPTASTPVGGHGMPRPPVTGTPTIPSQPARGSASATTSRCSRATCCSRSSRDASGPRLRDGFVPHFVMHGTLSIEGGLPAVIETR